MTTTTVPAFLTMLRDRLQAREGLKDVQVSTGPVSDQALSASDVIEFVAVEQDKEWAALGKVARREEYIVSGALYAVRYGADEATITEARDRAYQLLSEIEDELWADPTLDKTVRVAGVVKSRLDQGITGSNGEARGAAIQFEIKVEAPLNRA